MGDVAEELIRQAQDGDVRAFEEIYRQYSPGVYTLALKMMSNEADAQDVTQEVFLTLFDKLNSFRFESALKTWVYRITVNTSLNIRKKRSRVQGPLVPFDEDVVKDPKNAAGETQILQGEADLLMESLLNKLPSDQKACLVLRSVEGLSYQHIAETLEININTVRSRIRRARQTLLALKHEVLANEL